MLAQAFGARARRPVRGADDIVAWLCAAAAFLALGHTFRHGELVRVGLWIERLAPRARRRAEICALSVTALFVGYMLWAVARFVYESWKFNEVAQGLIKIPIWIPQLSFVLGVLIFFIAVLDELVAVLRGSKPAYQVAEEAAARARATFRRRCDARSTIGALVLLGAAAACCSSAACGSRISLAAVAWVGLQFFTSTPPDVNLFQSFWGSSAIWTLAALPLFVWMGEILYRTKLSEEMFEGLAPWLGWLPGRLMHVNVLALRHLRHGVGLVRRDLRDDRQGRAAGAASAAATTRRPASARSCGAGTLGILLPPSIIMVVYAVAAEVSILKVFLAGFLPGLLLMALFSGYIVVWALLNPGKTPRETSSITVRARSSTAAAHLIPCLAADRVHRLGDGRPAGRPRPKRRPTACSARSRSRWWSGGLDARRPSGRA